MKNKERYIFLALLIITSISFVIAGLFVILFYRLFPGFSFLVLPAVFIFGVIFGALIYLPFLYFIEKLEG